MQSSHQKYSRSLLSEHIHKYLIETKKGRNPGISTLTYLLPSRNRIFITINRADLYTQAFYKFETRGQVDILIKYSYLRYPHQIWSFIDTIDEAIEKVEKIYVKRLEIVKPEKSENLFYIEGEEEAWNNY